MRYLAAFICLALCLTACHRRAESNFNQSDFCDEHKLNC